MLGYVITPDSSGLWKSRGSLSFHSRALVMCAAGIILRCAANASQRMAINRRVATKEIIEPIDDRAFQGVMASG